jgi:hypothetical protein
MSYFVSKFDSNPNFRSEFSCLRAVATWTRKKRKNAVRLSSRGHHIMGFAAMSWTWDVPQARLWIAEETCRLIRCARSPMSPRPRAVFCFLGHEVRSYVSSYDPVVLTLNTVYNSAQISSAYCWMANVSYCKIFSWRLLKFRGSFCCCNCEEKCFSCAYNHWSLMMS